MLVLLALIITALKYATSFRATVPQEIIQITVDNKSTIICFSSHNYKIHKINKMTFDSEKSFQSSEFSLDIIRSIKPHIFDSATDLLNLQSDIACHFVNNSLLNNLKSYESNEETLDDFKQYKMRTIATRQIEDIPISSYEIVEGKLKFHGGWAVSIINDLSEMLNFTIEALQHNGYIINTKNGSVSGPGEHVISGKADIVIGKLYILRARKNFLDATHQISSHKLSMLFVQPERGLSRSLYVSPIKQRNYMIVLTGVIILLLLSSLLINNLEHRYDINGQSREEADVTLNIFFAIFNQSYIIPPTNASKIMFSFTLFTFIIVWTSYSAFLTSALMQIYLPISSISDLMQNGYRIFSPTYNQFACQSVFEQYGKKEHDSDKACSNYKNDNDTIQNVFSGNNAAIKFRYEFIFSAWSLKYTNQQICQVSHLPLINNIPASFAYVRKGSPLIEPLNRKLLALRQRGFIARYSTILKMQTEVYCSIEKFAYRGNVTLHDVFSLFGVLGTGAVVAIALFISELFFLILNTKLNWMKYIRK